jgi:catalase
LPNDSKPSTQYGFSALTDKGAVPRLVAIGVILAVVTGCFLYVGGWLSPQKLTPARVIDAFEQLNGTHPGFRRNHAKGVCIVGSFESNGRGARLSKAVVFQPGSVPVVGRLALASAQPFAEDGPKEIRSMALSFRLPNGEEWRTGMNDIPVFPFQDAEAFYAQLQAALPDPATGKSDPTKMKAFVESHPASAKAFGLIGASAFSSGFANASYNGLNAFRFVSADGVSTFVRWSMTAVDAFEPAPTDQPANPDKNYLFNALITRVAQGPLQWHLMVTIGQPGDPTNDATVPWPADREQVDVGTLTVDRVEAEADGNCRDINYDPLVLPSGIEGSDDLLLSARSATYSQSFKRRAGEAKEPSAVQTSTAATGN